MVVKDSLLMELGVYQAACNSNKTGHLQYGHDIMRKIVHALQHVNAQRGYNSHTEIPVPEEFD